MTDNFEFEDVVKVRKSLLIFSLIGIFLKHLTKYSTGNIEFFGFKIPVEDSSFITNLVGGIIIFYIIILLIRYYDVEFPKRYKEFQEKRRMQNKLIFQSDSLEYGVSEMKRSQNYFIRRLKLLRVLKTFIDLYFPIIFGLISLFIVFC